MIDQYPITTVSHVERDIFIREILRNYKAVINARRREMGQKPLTTAQIVDEICDFVANQQAVFLGGHYILQGSRNR
nr:hypothetical protein [Escherichia coli]